MVRGVRLWKTGLEDETQQPVTAYLKKGGVASLGLGKHKTGDGKSSEDGERTTGSCAVRKTRGPAVRFRKKCAGTPIE